MSYNINQAAVRHFTERCRESRKLCDALVNNQEGLLIADVLAGNTNTSEKELQFTLLKIRDIGGLARTKRDTPSKELKQTDNEKDDISLDISRLILSKENSEGSEPTSTNYKRPNNEREKIIRSSSNRKRPVFHNKF